MFLGFDETCRHINNLYDKTFPLISVIVTPYVIVIWILSVIISLTAWFLGYWRCNSCNKVFPFYKKKKIIIEYSGWDDSREYKYCYRCNRKESH
jgi:hypothetical protein